MNNINLYNGDCINTINEHIQDNSIDCIITSPPYNKKYFSKNDKIGNQILSGFQINYSEYFDDLDIVEYENWMIDFINLCMVKLKDNGSLFFNHKPIRHDNQVYHPLKFILRTDAKIYQEIIWNRKNSPNVRDDMLLPRTERVYWLCKNKPITNKQMLNDCFRSEVWEMSPRVDKEHPATFPLQLPLNCILLSTNKGDIVLDPFMGSGTTGIACVKTNRNFIGIELNGKYFGVVKNRIEKEQKQCNQKLF